MTETLCFQVIELLGEENVNVHPDQMAEIISLLRKETILEEESQKEREEEKVAEKIEQKQ